MLPRWLKQERQIIMTIIIMTIIIMIIMLMINIMMIITTIERKLPRPPNRQRRLPPAPTARPCPPRLLGGGDRSLG